jgi:hypothetical protein
VHVEDLSEAIELLEAIERLCFLSMRGVKNDPEYAEALARFTAAYNAMYE